MQLAWLEACSERLNRAAEILLAALIAVTVAAATAQVVFRYGVQASLTWSEELARYAFIWAIFIGTSVAARRGQHIAVDSLVKTLPRVVQRWLRLLNAIPQKSSSLEISIAWVYAAAVIGAALTVLHLVNAALRPELRESS
jgi:TRAP-type C4-dicarboxylate transport system permease small subunit